MCRQINGGIPEARHPRRGNTGYVENLFAAVFNHNAVNGGRSLLHHEVCHGRGNNVHQVGVAGNYAVRKFVLASCREYAKCHTNNNRQNGCGNHQAERNPDALAEFFVHIRAVGAAAPIEFGHNIGQPLDITVPSAFARVKA